MSTPRSTHGRYPNDPFDVLLVEDNPGDVRLIREAFEETDCNATLHVVTDGADALDFLAKEDPYEPTPVPDLVLLDLNLPGRNGEEVLATIRDDPRLRRLPVLVLTSSESSTDVVRCYEAGANAYLTKPAGHGEFVSMVETVEEFWFSMAKLPPR